MRFCRGLLRETRRVRRTRRAVPERIVIERQRHALVAGCIRLSGTVLLANLRIHIDCVGGIACSDAAWAWVATMQCCAATPARAARNTAACRAARVPTLLEAAAYSDRLRCAHACGAAARQGGQEATAARVLTAAAAWTMRMIVRWRICMLYLAGPHSYPERLNRPTVVVSTR